MLVMYKGIRQHRICVRVVELADTQDFGCDTTVDLFFAANPWSR